jgi:hypothetical protein
MMSDIIGRATKEFLHLGILKGWQRDSWEAVSQ